MPKQQQAQGKPKNNKKQNDCRTPKMAVFPDFLTTGGWEEETKTSKRQEIWKWITEHLHLGVQTEHTKKSFISQESLLYIKHALSYSLSGLSINDEKV